MRAEIVRTETSDGIRLDGAFLAPQIAKTDDLGIDAVLLVHGTGANFYSSSLLKHLALAFRDSGIAAVIANTRGRDLICTASTRDGPKLLGAAYEIVSDCVYDLPAWLDFLRERGYSRLALVGHSLGAIKSVFALRKSPRDDVVRLVAISPARLSYSHFVASSKAEVFLEDFQTAQACVDRGAGEDLLQIKFPIPYLVTAGGYLDKYGPHENYNVLKYVHELDIPTLFTFGSEELTAHPAFRGLPEAIAEAVDEESQDVTTGVIAGADHFYGGTMNELWQRVRKWLSKRAES